MQMPDSTPSDPVAPQGRFIDASGIRTFIIDEGGGEPLVLIHGSGAAIDGHLTWYRTIEALSPAFRVIAFDQIGFGRTDMPADRRYRNRLERTPHAIALLDALGIEGACLVGHSEGGFIATRIAIERPDLVSRLVIVTSGATSPALGGGKDGGWSRASVEAYDYAAQTVDEETFVRASRRSRATEDARFDSILRANYRLAVETGNIDLFLDLPASETDPAEYVKLQEEWLFPHLDALHLPTLLVWAAEDETVPVERGLALMALLPCADFHLFGSARHMVMHDRAEDFARLLSSWCHDRPTRGHRPGGGRPVGAEVDPT